MVNPILDAVRRLADDERLGALVTVIAGPDTGTKAVVDADAGVVAGKLPADIADDVLADAGELMDHERSRALDYGDTRVFIETVAPPPVLLAFGAGHITQPLSRMAKEAGFRVVVGDARAAWATAERFPEVDHLIVGWPDVVLEAFPPDRRTYVALLSHDARFEEPVFAAIRDVPVRYIGAMGSRRTHRARLERLRGRGWSEEQLERIHGPIGIDIGAETPAETAIAILAEMIKVRYGHGTGEPLRGVEGRIHRQRGEEAGTE